MINHLQNMLQHAAMSDYCTIVLCVILMLGRVLLASSNYPDKYHLWAPWNKEANIAISKLDKFDTTILAPRPYVLPIKWLPYGEIGLLPKTEKAIEGIIHYPRYIYPLPKRAFYPYAGYSYRYFIGKYIEKNLNKQDLIHCHHLYPDGFGLLNFCKRTETPLIVDIHGDAFFSKFLSNERFRKNIYSVIDYSSKIVVISKKILKLSKENNFPEHKLSYVPLGVDIKKFKVRDHEKLKKELNIRSEFVILFVGKLIKEKGIDTLLYAISQINRPFQKKIVTFIIGFGPNETYFKNLSKKLKIDDIVFFLGEKPQEEIKNWYSISDIFILPSLSEGRPMVINEAMASGCAIIASNLSGIPEQVKDGYNGFLVYPKDVNGIKDRIQFLLENPSELEKMKINSRKRVLEEGWTWDEYAKKINSLYKKV